MLRVGPKKHEGGNTIFFFLQTENMNFFIAVDDVWEYGGFERCRRPSSHLLKRRLGKEYVSRFHTSKKKIRTPTFKRIINERGESARESNLIKIKNNTTY